MQSSFAIFLAASALLKWTFINCIKVDLIARPWTRAWKTKSNSLRMTTENFRNDRCECSTLSWISYTPVDPSFTFLSLSQVVITHRRANSYYESRVPKRIWHRQTQKYPSDRWTKEEFLWERPRASATNPYDIPRNRNYAVYLSGD